MTATLLEKIVGLFPWRERGFASRRPVSPPAGRWLLLLALVSAPVLAQDEGAILDRVSLQAQASQEVPNDRMHTVMVVQVEDPDPAQLARRANQTMQWALDVVAGTKGITSESGGYRTRPVYRDASLSHWRAEQELVLESSDFPALSTLVGRLQERLQVQSMRFNISEESRRNVENQLIDQALAAFKARAARVRASLGAGGWRIVHINVDTQGGPQPMPVYRMEAAAAKPAVEGGSSKVTVTVSGSIQLLPGGTVE